MGKKVQRAIRWVYKKRTTILMIIAIILILSFLFGQNFMKIYKLEREKHQLLNQIQSEQERGEALDAEYKQIGSKSYIEYIARKSLKLYYPDEKVVVITDPNTSSQSTTDSKAEGETNE